MAALVIESSNPSNLKLLAELAKKMGDYATSIQSADVEDLFFGEMINTEKTGEQVSREDVMRKLNTK